MASPALKAKVLFSWGLLVAVLGGLFAPNVVKALVPFAICVVAAALAMITPDLIDTAKGRLASRKHFPVISQATRSFANQAYGVISTQSNTRATWCEHVDYDNYLIPSYLRKREAK